MSIQGSVSELGQYMEKYSITAQAVEREMLLFLCRKLLIAVLLISVHVIYVNIWQCTLSTRRLVQMKCLGLSVQRPSHLKQHWHMFQTHSSH